MKACAKTMAVFMAVLISQARAERASKLATVIVYVQHSIHEPPPQTLLGAELLAAAMFRQVGVQVNWRIGAPHRSDKKRLISIEITSSRPPKTIHQNALAYANAFEGIHITIFWDRLARAAQNGTPISLLAHVLVHEITHVLQRAQGHSDEGIMKAHWTADDIWSMTRKPLPFDQQTMMLIHNGLTARSEPR